MVSLAVLRYSDVLAEYGGPIQRVDTGELPVLGTRHALANAYLRAELTEAKPARAIYGSADGTGVAQTVPRSYYNAISEALGRWAYLALRDSRSAALYGFDVDPSANGMVAFPGLFRAQAQRRAREAAIVQFALISWWDGRLPAERLDAPYPGVELMRIHHSAGSGEVVVLFRRTRAGYVYGHAYGADVAAAVRRAAVGLARAEHVLAAHRACGALLEPANPLERRALFFASEAGAERFNRRLLSGPRKPERVFRSLYDGEIPGPWSRWATVWRCCVAMPTDAYLEPDEDFFFW